MELNPEELESRWLELQSSLQEVGAKSLIQVIAHWDDPKLRNQMYRYAIRKLGGGTESTVEALDHMDAIGTYAISQALEQAGQGEEASFWLEEASVAAYNLAANFCDCWGDGANRQSRHFEQGLIFANWALDLRVILQKDPASFALAYWVRGKHFLSLRKSYEAAEAFSEAVRAEAEVERTWREARNTDRESPSHVMARAFLGLAQKQAGRDSGLYDESLNLLQDMAGLGGEPGEDAKFFLVQIEESSRLNL